MMAGFIHFDCYCGLDIYFFGNSPSGEAPLEAIDSFRSNLGTQQHAIYSSRDDAIVACPQCDSLIQLPTPEIVAFLAQKSLAASKTEGTIRAGHPLSDGYYPPNHADGYSNPITELN